MTTYELLFKAREAMKWACLADEFAKATQTLADVKLAARRMALAAKKLRAAGEDEVAVDFEKRGEYLRAWAKRHAND